MKLPDLALTRGDDRAAEAANLDAVTSLVIDDAAEVDLDDGAHIGGWFSRR